MQHAQPYRDMLTERMQHMIDDGLAGGFLPTICGPFGSNVSYNASMAPNRSKQNSPGRSSATTLGVSDPPFKDLLHKLGRTRLTHRFPQLLSFQLSSTLLDTSAVGLADNASSALVVSHKQHRAAIHEASIEAIKRVANLRSARSISSGS
jgi:hypothetical protein